MQKEGKSIMIRILSEELIHKIAAGEVIERPASIAKELIENALDASSTRITVHIEDAGQKLIKVSDNGIGMSPEELSLSLKRHATSKLSDADDLFNLTTLGFRGEALPSIAAVSKFNISSQSKDPAHPAWHITIIGGKRIQDAQISRAAGTTVEVRDLFFNTPARKKFLKAHSTEQSQIIRTIEELSLACPEVNFTVLTNNKQTLNLPSNKDLSVRVRNVLGSTHFDRMIPINIQHPWICIEGYISQINHWSGSRKNQFFFINNRPVSSKLITRALYDSYHGQMPERRHPAAVIKLRVNPDIIDVNVHPTKREVRISKSNELYHVILQSIKQALTSLGSSPVFSPPRSSASPAHSFMPERNLAVKEAVESFYARNTQSTQKLSEPYLIPRQDFKDTSVRMIGQFSQLYIVAESGGELWLIDQHAAEERVLYEKFAANFLNMHEKQKLLMPYHWDVSPSQFSSISAVLPVLNDIGIHVEVFGTNSFVVREIPALLGSIHNIKLFLESLIEHIGTARDTLIPQKETIIRAACRAAVKSRDFLQKPQLEELVKNLKKCKQPFTCPHGRPTLVRLTKHEIDRRFGR